MNEGTDSQQLPSVLPQSHPVPVLSKLVNYNISPVAENIIPLQPSSRVSNNGYYVMPDFNHSLTDLGEKFGQLTREDKKMKLINKENNVYFLNFVKKWYDNYKGKRNSRIENTLSVQMQYDNKTVCGDLDTGCNVSLINYSLVKNKEDIFPVKADSFIAGNGSNIEVMGVILLKINIQGIEYKVNAFVLKDVIFEILLGNNFFLEHGLIVDFRKKEITFDTGDSIKMDQIWVEYWVEYWVKYWALWLEPATNTLTITYLTLLVRTFLLVFASLLIDKVTLSFDKKK